jgi:hypothetical protein
MHRKIVDGALQQLGIRVIYQNRFGSLGIDPSSGSPSSESSASVMRRSNFVRELRKVFLRI